MGQTNYRGKIILVVEDEPGIAMVCMRTLTAEGFQIDVAVNGQDGLEMWRQKDYDLCISDIRTPQMNGMELYQKLVDENPGVVKKFIFTTGDVLSGDVKGFLGITGVLYLPKPFTPEELKNIVRKALDTI